MAQTKHQRDTVRSARHANDCDWGQIQQAIRKMLAEENAPAIKGVDFGIDANVDEYVEGEITIQFAFTDNHEAMLLEILEAMPPRNAE